MIDRRLPTHAHGAIEAEILNEKVSSLKRAADRAADALAALSATGADEAEYAPRLEAATARVWEYLVQRELCGFVDNAGVIADLDVPRAIMARLGAGPSR